MSAPRQLHPHGPRAVLAAMLGCTLSLQAAQAEAQTLARGARPGTVPSAAASFSPAHVPTAAELREAGWSPADEPATVRDPVRRPTLPVQRGVALLAGDPAALPRPELVTAPPGEGEPLPLPLAARLKMLERRESPDGPVIAWIPRVRAREADGGAWIVGLDVPPFEDRQVPDQADLRAGFARAERHLATVPARASSTLKVNPGRRFRLEPREPPAAPEPLSSGVSLAPLRDQVEEDALLVFLPGRGWWTASLGEPAVESGAHELLATNLFVVGESVFASPVARADDAALELVEWRPPADSPRFLPFPRPEQAPWRCVIHDLRRREGRLEALVVVHDPRLRRGPEVETAASWAALLSFDGSAWTETRRLPLPGDARALQLRFDPAAPERLRLEHDARLLAGRTLAGR